MDDKDYEESAILLGLYENLVIMAKTDADFLMRSFDPNVEFLKIMAENHGFPKQFVDNLLAGYRRPK